MTALFAAEEIPALAPVRSKMGVHFSSASDDWATPADVYAALDAEFGFDLDACASDANAKARTYYTPAEDGLRQPWRGVVFCNPPYGRDIGAWIAKGHHSAREEGATVVMLIPSRTDTDYWHRYVMRADEIRFIRGRLRFGNAENSAPFPSAVVVFRPAQSSD